MKTSLQFSLYGLLCTFFVSSSAWAFRLDTLSVFEASTQGKIVFMARGAYNPQIIQADLVSSHYGKCIDVRIENNTNEAFAIKLETGTLLLSNVNKAQNMLITKTSYCSLKPYEKCYGRVFALCAELNKNAPDIYVSYKLGKMATGALLKLAKTIETEEAQHLAGQYAVWAVTDKATVKELGEKYDVLEKCQQLLDKAAIRFSVYGNTTTTVGRAMPSTPKKALLRTDSVLKTYPQQEEIPSFDTQTLYLETPLTTNKYPRQQHRDKGIRIGEIDATNDHNEWITISVACILLLLLTLLFFKFMR